MIRAPVLKASPNARALVPETCLKRHITARDTAEQPVPKTSRPARHRRAHSPRWARPRRSARSVDRRAGAPLTHSRSPAPGAAAQAKITRGLADLADVLKPDPTP